MQCVGSGRGVVAEWLRGLRLAVLRGSPPVLLLVVPEAFDEVDLGAGHGQTPELQLLF